MTTQTLDNKLRGVRLQTASTTCDTTANMQANTFVARRGSGVEVTRPNQIELIIQERRGRTSAPIRVRGCRRRGQSSVHEVW